MAKITPEELIQDINEHLQEDYSFDPPRVPRWFITNIFGRVFAHLVGRASTEPKMLRCTEAGELKTAPTTTGIEHHDAKIGTATDAYGAAWIFDQVAARVDIFIWDHPAYITRSLDGVVWEDSFEAPVGFYSIDCRTHSFKIMNKTAGQAALFQLIGWW